MTTINFTVMTDAELQNFIEQAGEEQDNRIRAKSKEAIQKFWKAAKELYAIDKNYELFDNVSYPLTIEDLVLDNEEKCGFD